MSPEKLKGWRPQVNISIARGTHSQGYAPPSRHLTLSVITPAGFDTYHKAGGETVSGTDRIAPNCDSLI